jgi:hypothetical protein
LRVCSNGLRLVQHWLGLLLWLLYLLLHLLLLWLRHCIRLLL